MTDSDKDFIKRTKEQMDNMCKKILENMSEMSKPQICINSDNRIYSSILGKYINPETGEEIKE